MTSTRWLPSAVVANRTLLGLSGGVYLVGVILGLALVLTFGLPSGVAPPADAQQVFDDGVTLPSLLWNNLLVVGMLVLGGFLLGVPTLAGLGFNGVAFGVVVGSVVTTGSVPLPALVLALVPHALPELVGVWIAGAAGLKLPREIVRYLRSNRDELVSRDDFVDVFWLGALAVALTTVAALIEVYVTLELF